MPGRVLARWPLTGQTRAGSPSKPRRREAGIRVRPVLRCGPGGEAQQAPDTRETEGTPMQELRFVAVSEDGSYAVLAIPGRSGRFMLPIDDRLRAVAKGQFSRLRSEERRV